MQVFEKGNRRVAIVGFCQDSRDWVRYEDESLECWGLNRGYIFQRRAERWYDMHSPAIRYNPSRRPGNHTDWLKQFPGPVYMHEADPEIPNSVTYPLAQVAEAVAGNIYRVDKEGVVNSAVDEPYLTSSIAQQIALAIAEGYDEIHLYGIDLNTDSEYAWQKPGVEYMIGVAAGKGIKVVLPDNCPLLKGNIYGRGYLSPKGENMSLEQLQARAKAQDKERAHVTQQLHALQGARKELEFIQSQMVPGIDHERLDERKHKMEEAIGGLQHKLLQIEGGMKELAYWIHQTPNGQEPKEAMEQIANGNGHNPEGPVTALEVLQYTDQAEVQILTPV